MEACWTAVGAEDVRSAESVGEGAEKRVGVVGGAEEGEEVGYGGYRFSVEDKGGKVGPW